MAKTRLSLAAGEAGLTEGGTVAVFAPMPDTDLSSFETSQVRIISKDARIHDAFAGFDCRTEAQGNFAGAVVVVPRAKAHARALVAEAVRACPNGTILIDGQKTDGVDPLFRACRARRELLGEMTRAHGRAFWFRAAPVFDDWRFGPGLVEGFQTAPGVFSADGIDPGSALLARHLPKAPGRYLADLGAGWGFLAARALENTAIEEIHLVESDAAALDCARVNIHDERARFHWADATRWEPPMRFDTVVMNPPFHQGRKSAPQLGVDFVAAAAAILRPSGLLMLVANRHLPYEAALGEKFATVEEIAGDGRFKVLAAHRPARRKG